MRPRSSEQGFTLVELLVAVAILALLAVLAVPRVAAAMDDARHAEMVREIRAIQDSLEQHYLRYDFYPDRLARLVERGFLPADTAFKSPVSRKSYFYAVDYNEEDRKPQAYILGDAGKQTLGSTKKQLYRTGLFPFARPAADRAWAWLDPERPTQGLTLFREDNITPLPPDEYPATLESYRDGCRDSDPGTLCDLWTN